jgi:hypothetical protein
MRDAVRPHRDFYVIKVHDLEGSLSVVPGSHTEKLRQEFFVDPSHWLDQRPEKVTEHHSCQSSHVSGTIALVGVNFAALC